MYSHESSMRETSMPFHYLRRGSNTFVVELDDYLLQASIELCSWERCVNIIVSVGLS